ncbi:heterokaryon incompatibility protein-domain-containing protein [Cadophora sp. MPI-SDFR-AT-0126]|nr:heterokaryon incompatibility protein-domain-containing protein [Leotiomycetes sp. MPI-SDFR-AT-0126]
MDSAGDSIFAKHRLENEPSELDDWEGLRYPVKPTSPTREFPPFSGSTRRTREYCKYCAPYYTEKDPWRASAEPTGPKTPRHVSITIGTILRKGRYCVVCRLICKLLSNHIDRNEEVQLYYDYYRCSVRQQQKPRGYVIPEHALRHQDIPSWMKLSNYDPLNPEMIRNWIKTCEDQHGSSSSRFRSLSRSRNPVDITLIDVNKYCLVRASSSINFCALSYVWGKIEDSLRTTTKNRALLESPGSLQQPQNWSQTPRVVKDSIGLVSAIGERFLWVDALCIEQDNEALKQSQIMQMDIIYSHALLTIVALSGKNANEPLPRVTTRDSKELKGPYTTSTCFMGNVVVGPSFHQTLHDSVYDKRGWTFQERLLSQRCLFISEYQSFFRCHTQLQTECPCLPDPNFHDLDILPRSSQSEGYGTWFADFLQIREPSAIKRNSTAFSHYTRLLKAYRKKHLSDASDTLNAFSGVLAALAQQNQWQFVSGIPEEQFDLGLLWSPDPNQTVERNEAFASWSWAGWGCTITWQHIPEFWWQAPMIQEGRTEIEDLQTFYQTPRRPIARHFHLGAQQQLFDTKGVLSHPSLASRAGSGIDVLSFRAEAVSFEGFRAIKHQIKGIKSPVISILDPQGRNCGIHYGEPFFTDSADLRKMELILLSRFRQSKTTWEGSRVFSMAHGIQTIYQLVFHDEAYPFSEWSLLNIMLIQWKGDQAERLNIGLMHERAFNNAGPVKKNILLA